jgi:hypothetical protein
MQQRHKEAACSGAMQRRHEAADVSRGYKATGSNDDLNRPSKHATPTAILTP